MSKAWSRREFLKIGGAAVVTAAAACSGLGALAVQSPAIQYTDTHLEGARSTTKVLVTYATRAGSTVQVAETIARTLGEAGANVDIRPIKKVTGVQEYGAVVIGSAIRMGKWLPEAVQFVKTHQAALASKPTAYFLVSGVMREGTPEARQEVQAYLDPVREILEPRSLGMFAGKIDPGTLSFVDRTIMQMMKSPSGDWRNWEAIRGWARELQPILIPA